MNSSKIFFDCVHPFYDEAISLNELQLSLHKSRTNKAAGTNDINIEFYKNLPPKWHHYILNLFNSILTHEELPKNWGSMQTCLIYKKGNKRNPLNYRSLALINSISKIFKQILSLTLQKWYC